jgi:hypothetical protein
VVIARQARANQLKTKQAFWKCIVKGVENNTAALV